MYSMTGYASHAGTAAIEAALLDWEWEMRAVNGRGLDIRFRLPEGLGALEKLLRDKLAAHLSRGNVSVSLRLRITRADAALGVDAQALSDALAALKLVQSQAEAAGVELRAPTALDLLGWRGVVQHGPDLAALPTDTVLTALSTDFDRLLDAFAQARTNEGAALAVFLAAQLDQIADLTAQARALLQDRSAELRAHFQRALAQVQDAGRADPERVAQELALLAVKTDLTEELDRLEAHCASGRALLVGRGPVGRKLDFLTQEFNREANTLCSKAQHLDMTRIGLDLKTVIDQMREQVQNVE